MTHLTPIAINHGLTARELRLPDFIVSWAGETPGDHGFCFGSNDGRIQYTTIDGLPENGPIQVVDPSEAINGVAFMNEFMAVSTGNEVALFQGLNDGTVSGAVYDGGAHDVITSPSGRFIAPIGVGGLLMIHPEFGEIQSVRAITISKMLNFYKTASMGTSPKGDVFCSAVRKDGLATTVLSPDEGAGFTLTRTFAGLDIVDVCSLASEDFPRAALALGKDRSLHLIRDVSTSLHPSTIRFEGLQGTAYGILRAHGHIVLLTSKFVYVLTDLASRFVTDKPIDVLTAVHSLQYEAVDVYFAHDHLLIIMPDHVIAAEMDSILSVLPTECYRSPVLSHQAGETLPAMPLSFANVS